MKTYLIVCHPEDRECITVFLNAPNLTRAKRLASSAARSVHGAGYKVPVYFDSVVRLLSPKPIAAEMPRYHGVLVELAPA